jgi:hypothetical protein
LIHHYERADPFSLQYQSSQKSLLAVIAFTV